MPRTSDENQRLRDERKEAILVAALPVFARKGLAATKGADIAAEAGSSYGLVYHYFDNKEAIFAALVERALQGALAVAIDAQRQPGAPWDRLVWLLEASLRGARERPDYHLIVIQAMTSEAAPDRARAHLAAYGPRIFRAYVELIGAAQAAGQAVAGDPVALATAFSACLQGLAIAARTSAEPHALPDPSLILRMLKA